MSERGASGPGQASRAEIAADVLAALTDGVLAENADRIIEFVNQPFADIFLGGDPSVIIGVDCDVLARESADSFLEPSAWIESTERLITGRKPVHGEQWGLTDGRWIERDYAPRLRDGVLIGHLWLYRDITDQRRLTLDLQELRAKLASRTSPITAKSPDYDPEANATIQQVDGWLNDGAAVLILVRLEHIDRVNDAYGRTTGDAVISQVDGLLRRRLPGMLIERIGGATFALAVRGDHDPAQLMAHVRSELGTIAEVQGNAIMLHMTLGSARLNPHTEVPNARLLLRRARLALAEARRSRHDLAFDAALLDAERTRDELALALPGAIRSDELTVVYQPIVRLVDRSIVGHESLVRWRHPSYGVIGAATFIPIAEAMGVASDVDAWVVEHALADLPRVLARGGQTLTVNISGASLLTPEALKGTLAHAVAANDLRPEQVVLEITETAVSNLDDEARATVRRLSDMGFAIAIDDFGVGSSSLGLLHDTPFDIIKLDKSFIRNIDDERVRTLVSATNALAETFSASVVAEGIEHEAQLNALIECGVELGQGWHFAPPTPLA